MHHGVAGDDEGQQVVQAQNIDGHGSKAGAGSAGKGGEEPLACSQCGQRGDFAMNYLGAMPAFFHSILSTPITPPSRRCRQREGSMPARPEKSLGPHPYSRPAPLRDGSESHRLREGKA